MKHTKTKKPDKLDIRIRRVHALFDELLLIEEGVNDVVETLIEHVDWNMVDHETIKKVFTLLMSNCPSDADMDPEHEFSEERRNDLAAQAALEHRRVMALALAHGTTGAMSEGRALKHVDLWGAQ